MSILTFQEVFLIHKKYPKKCILSVTKNKFRILKYSNKILISIPFFYLYILQKIN